MLLPRTSIPVLWLCVFVLGLIPVARAQVDCDGNGVEDHDDLQAGTHLDCDGNGIPDVCDDDPLALTLDREVLLLPRIPRVLAIADLDGNGAPDLAAGTRGTRADSRVYVFLNRGGADFAPVLEIPVAEGLGGLAAGDIDGDGDPDLVTSGDAGLSLYLNDGRAGFTPGASIEVAVDSPHVQLADLDGDGDADLLSTTGGDRRIELRFLESGVVEGPVTSIDVGGTAGRFTLADLEGDGDLDLAVTLRREGRVSIVRQTAPGRFAPPETIELAGLDPVNAVLAPLDARPGLDLAVATEVALELYYQEPEGSFLRGPSYPGLRSVVRAADLNLDGDVDLVSPSLDPHGVIVRGNDGEGRFDRHERFLSARAPTTLALGDLDGDGTPDVALSSASPSSISILRGGEFEGVSVLTQKIPLDHCEQHIRKGCAPHAGALADLDGDGDLDLISSNTIPASISVVLHHGEGQFELLENRLIPGTHPFSLAAGDLDGDGKPDVVTADDFAEEVSFHRGRGDGTFEAAKVTPVVGDPFDVELGDLDGDGHLDVALAAARTDEVVLLHQGEPGELVERPGSRLRTGARPVAIAIADLDDDGSLDLVTADETSRTLTPLVQDAGGVFRRGAPVELRWAPNHVTVGDLDADGHLDLVTVSSRAEELAVAHGLGGGEFQLPRHHSPGRAPYSATLLDFDDDGLLDIVTADDVQGTVTFLPATGSREFGIPFHYPVGEGLRHVFGADLDGDGDLDLVTPDRLGFSFTVLWSQRAGVDRAPAFLESICTRRRFQDLARPGRGAGAVRTVKFVLPHGLEAPDLPLLFQNTRQYELHLEFLLGEFGERLPGLDPQTYTAWVSSRVTRRLVVGTIREIHEGGRARFGLDFFARFDDPLERPTPGEVRDILATVSEKFSFAELAYAPVSAAALAQARSWPPEVIDFPLILDGLTVETDYEAYTPGVGFGRLRFLTLGELEALARAGELSLTDVLVLERAPGDIEGVVGGILTAEPQAELAHLGIRAARRGTPNAYWQAAWNDAALRELEGELVRLEFGREGVEVREASLEEAEEHWESSRPRLSRLPEVDPLPRELLDLEALELRARPGVGDAIASHGGKAVHLARLGAVLESLDPSLVATGLAIPVAHYLDFLDANRLPGFLDPGRELTYRQYLEEIVTDPRFTTDSALRSQALAAFRDHADDHGEVSPALLAELADRLVEVFGSSEVKLRFRSSSTVEDLLEFNGAGLYDSTSACVADDLDADGEGPSRCDPDQDDERGLERALKRVWASLWNHRAHEERTYFGIPADRSAMGILVTRAFRDERASGVIFSGHPSRLADGRYLVTAQVGEASVVRPEPGVLAEKSLLVLREGRVIDVVEAGSSSLLPAGQRVLERPLLERLGATVAAIDAHLDFDPGPHDPRDILLDLEFKVTASGELAIKQLRPFLRPVSVTTLPDFELTFGDGLPLCGQFRPARGLDREMALRSIVELDPTPITVELADGEARATWIRSLDLGPEASLATPREPGRVRLEPAGSREGHDLYEGIAEQELELGDGRRLEVELRGLHVLDEGEPGALRSVYLDLDRIGEEVTLTATLKTAEGAVIDRLHYAPCERVELPAWRLSTRLEDGTELLVEERSRPDDVREAGPAELERARLWFADGQAYRDVTGYRKLIYAASRHNRSVEIRMLLEPPVELAGVPGAIHAVDLRTPEPLEAFAGEAVYLDEDLAPLKTVSLLSFERRDAGASGASFRRGDVNATGGVDQADAVGLLVHLFVGGAAPRCPASADASPDGRLDVSDVVAILAHLYLGAGPLAEPFAVCGPGTRADELPCDLFPPCE